MFPVYPTTIKSPRHSYTSARAQSLVEQDNAYFKENTKYISTDDLMLEIARNRVNFKKGLKLEA